MISKSTFRGPTLFEKALVLAGLSLFVTGIIHFYQGQQPSVLPTHDDLRSVSNTHAVVSTISGNELFQYNGTLLLDAREFEAFSRGHIDGAVLVPASRFNTEISDILPLLAIAKRVVVYCDSSQCGLADQEAQNLRDIGLDKVFVLAGGYEEWKGLTKTLKPTAEMFVRATP